MSRDRPRPDANRCFVCGPANPVGLRVAFRMDQGICRAEFTPAPDHSGYADMMHGGILYSLLDDVMANWLFLQRIRGHTARCEVRYRQPVEIGTPLAFEGRLRERRRNVATMEGLARRVADRAIVAEATASFVIVDEPPPDQPAGDS